MKKVLILTAAFGEGHNTAARNLRDAFQSFPDEASVRVLDLFEHCYGNLNNLAKKSYLGMVRHAPALWGGIYSIIDSAVWMDRALGSFGSLKTELAAILAESQPDAVVSTFPAYSHAIREIYRDHAEKPFRFFTVVTDSITINSVWFRAPSDLFFVPNDDTADILIERGIPRETVHALGFPVSARFGANPRPLLAAPGAVQPRKILYVINTGKAKSGKVIDELLENKANHLTITTGRDADLRVKLAARTAHVEDRCTVLGWTNQMPELMMDHHLIISKAGGATVQECLAAECPMIVNQVIPGQEEGNAWLIERHQLGAVAESNRDIPILVEKAFENDSRVWSRWKQNVAEISRPQASVKIAHKVLDDAGEFEKSRPRLNGARHQTVSAAAPPSAPRARRMLDNRMLLCDFHIHTSYSDGRLSVPEVVDFYGQRGFDCICITDHLADPRRLIGKFIELTKLTLNPCQIGEYFAVLEQERRRAWRQYRMLVMTGFEFNKDGYSRKTSAHLLAVDLKSPIVQNLDLPETIAQIHAQGGLAIASHPHLMKSEWGKNTLYLWENQEAYIPLLDAWEIANRNNIFTPVGLKNLPLIAGSDFHKPKHISSWKTLLACEKSPEAIKQCIRENRDIAFTLFRDEEPAAKRAPNTKLVRERKPAFFDFQAHLPFETAPA